MQQIAETPATSRRLFPQPSVLLARLFEHRSSLAFAASIALLVAVAAATAIHFSGNHDAHRGEPYATSLPGAPASGKDNSHAGASVVQTTINESFTPTLVTSRFKQKPGRPARRQATRTRSATGNGATAVNDDGFERVEAAGAQTATLTPVESATLEAHPATKELNGEASASSVFIEVAKRKTTRIELQTGDPNVRIIWLAPQTNGQQLLDKTTNNR
jgi:hypothetical protein